MGKHCAAERFLLLVVAIVAQFMDESSTNAAGWLLIGSAEAGRQSVELQRRSCKSSLRLMANCRDERVALSSSIVGVCIHEAVGRMPTTHAGVSQMAKFRNEACGMVCISGFSVGMSKTSTGGRRPSGAVCRKRAHAQWHVLCLSASGYSVCMQGILDGTTATFMYGFLKLRDESPDQPFDSVLSQRSLRHLLRRWLFELYLC